MSRRFALQANDATRARARADLGEAFALEWCKDDYIMGAAMRPRSDACPSACAPDARLRAQQHSRLPTCTRACTRACPHIMHARMHASTTRQPRAQGWRRWPWSRASIELWPHLVVALCSYGRGGEDGDGVEHVCVRSVQRRCARQVQSTDSSSTITT